MPRLVVPILPVARCRLAQRVEFAVERQDQRGVLGDAQIVAARSSTPCFAILSISLDERPRIDDDAVADHRELALAHHAGGQQRQLVGDAVDDERVAGIVAALEAHHDVGALARASRRSCPCLRRPIGSRRPRHSPRPVSSEIRRLVARTAPRVAGPCAFIARARGLCERFARVVSAAMQVQWNSWSRRPLRLGEGRIVLKAEGLPVDRFFDRALGGSRRFCPYS